MNIIRKESPVLSTLLVIGPYAVFGMLWILFSDSVALSLATSEDQLTRFQSIKGTAFIVVSAVFFYTLTYAAIQRLTYRNQRLESALRQALLLHRISRHNIRNSCNVIGGNIEILVDRNRLEGHERASAIRNHTDKLLSLSRKSAYLRDFLDPTTVAIEEYDIARLVTERSRAARERYPSAIIITEGPTSARATAHPQIDRAIMELIENAIEHNPSDAPRVWITVQSGPDSVSVTVDDDGPGLPAVEARVLRQQKETSTKHSQGIGLWLVGLTVAYSGGSITLDESDHGGASISLALPASSLREKILSRKPFQTV